MSWRRAASDTRRCSSRWAGTSLYYMYVCVCVRLCVTTDGRLFPSPVAARHERTLGPIVAGCPVHAHVHRSIHVTHVTHGTQNNQNQQCTGERLLHTRANQPIPSHPRKTHRIYTKTTIKINTIYTGELLRLGAAPRADGALPGKSRHGRFIPGVLISLGWAWAGCECDTVVSLLRPPRPANIYIESNRDRTTTHHRNS